VAGTGVLGNGFRGTIRIEYRLWIVTGATFNSLEETDGGGARRGRIGKNLRLKSGAVYGKIGLGRGKKKERKKSI